MVANVVGVQRSLGRKWFSGGDYGTDLDTAGSRSATLICWQPSKSDYSVGAGHVTRMDYSNICPKCVAVSRTTVGGDVANSSGKR